MLLLFLLRLNSMIPKRSQGTNPLSDKNIACNSHFHDVRIITRRGNPRWFPISLTFSLAFIITMILFVSGLDILSQNHIKHAYATENTTTSETRSEEHTSELQSRQYLVCRLLLEKKKTNCVIPPAYLTA